MNESFGKYCDNVIMEFCICVSNVLSKNQPKCYEKRSNLLHTGMFVLAMSSF